MWSTAVAHWPSLGSRISTVALEGNSITPITGSDSRIWKVSACSYFPSASMRTRHVALVCPGLNWTCRWDFPLKSSSFFALPSSVPMPESRWQFDTCRGQKRKRGEKKAAWLKKRRQRQTKTVAGGRWQAGEEAQMKGRLDIHTL